MSDKEFWGEIISTYTDADAVSDGFLVDVGALNVRFNGKIINRIACQATRVLDVQNKESAQLADDFKFIAENSACDGDGANAWGVFQMNGKFQDEKFWLVPNEVGGYTLLRPDEY